VVRLTGAVGIDDPGRADGLQLAGALDAAQVDHRPAELLKQIGDDLFASSLSPAMNMSGSPAEHLGFTMTSARPTLRPLTT
jgi:hypothetical protein